MKVIDLLNKIANGEELPKKIKYDNDIWKYDEMARDYLLIDKSGEEYLICEELNLMHALNDEVEVEEDKKIERIGANNYKWNYKYDIKTPQAVVDNLELVRQKINEIIDYLEEKENEN